MVSNPQGSLLGIATNDSPAYVQFQCARTIQQEWPFHCELDQPSSGQSIICFEQNTVAADVHGSAISEAFNVTRIQQCVFDL
jgi:hypothetical protein